MAIERSIAHSPPTVRFSGKCIFCNGIFPFLFQLLFDLKLNVIYAKNGAKYFSPKAYELILLYVPKVPY